MRERALDAFRGRRTVDPGELPIAESTLAVLSALPLEWLIVSSGFRVEHTSAAARTLGITKAGRLIDPAIRAEVTRAVRSREVCESELGNETGQGAVPRQLRLRVCPLGPQRAVVLIEDVTHPLRVDAMRRDFIVNVSHELKTPVGALLLLAEAVKSSLDEPQNLGRFVDRMQTEAERLSRLINDLTDLSRLQASDPTSKREAVPAQRLFAEALDSVRLIAARNDVDLVAADVGALTVEGDEDQLVTALRNLLLNAITYSPGDTRVTLSASVSHDHVDLMVSDQGIGFDMRYHDRIFGMFQRLHRQDQIPGTGIGLALVQKAVERMGGQIRAQSAPGQGARFEMDLPRA